MKMKYRNDKTVSAMKPSAAVRISDQTFFLALVEVRGSGGSVREA